MESTTNLDQLISFFSEFVSESRLQRFNEVIANRTRHITVVLEDIYQSHNASAVLRSCDCFGIQDVHIIEQRNKYTINPDVAMGAYKWINMHKYRSPENPTKECLQHLKSKGYTIVATSPHKSSYKLDTLPIDKKIALVFGTEIDGITSQVMEEADEFITIPMFGFTESFNISVSAALIMYELTKRLHKSELNWHLSEDEQKVIMLEWLKNTVNKPELLEKEFYARK
ncbi:MAG: RNA methyltransferase [Bacteroidetes bacterium]|nr:RNA methyltransferase [Bacteroidota bacterium]